MLPALQPDRFSALSPLFSSMGKHLAARAVLEKRVPGSVFVDRIIDPEAALVCAGKRFYLAGNPHKSNFNDQLREHFNTVIYPRAIEGGQAAFTLYYPNTDWEPAINTILKGKFPIWDRRSYFETTGPEVSWREHIPPGFEMRQVSQALLNEPGLKHRDLLADEMRSESQSIDHFLENCFGFCLVGRGEIAAWCLSEYNLDNRCEVGIETMPTYRRRGFATLTASALIEHARRQDIGRIGWHCWSSNRASIATAERTGFSLVAEYAAVFAFFEKPINLAVNGNMRFEQADYSGAAEWYERAVRAGGQQAWIFWNAACAHARTGAHKLAMQLLQGAIEHGFDDLERLQASEHLESLRKLPGWKTFLEKLTL
jgi:RimJ/RimL family protein N-acetyltransferase